MNEKSQQTVDYILKNATSAALASGKLNLILCAAKNDKEGALKEIEKSTLNISYVHDKPQISALDAAIRSFSHDTTALLIKFKAHEIYNQIASCPMMMAISSGNLEAVKLLHKNGNFLEHKREEPWIDTAVTYNAIPIIKYLLEAGQKMTSNALAHSCQMDLEDRLPMAQFLVENGAQVNSNLDLRSSDLNNAVIRGDYYMVEFLLKRGANPNDINNDKHILKYAASMGNLEIVKLLVEAGANIELADKTGLPLLSWSARNGNDEMCTFFIDRGVDINKMHEGDTALFEAIFFAKYATARTLLNLGADVNAGTASQNLPIHLASENSKVATLLLIKHGADLNVVGKESTPLLNAIVNYKTSIVELLIKSGANIEKSINGWTPLMTAAHLNQFNMVEALIHKGSSLIAPDGSNVIDVVTGDKAKVKALLEQAMLNKAAQVSDVSSDTPLLPKRMRI